MGLQNMFYNREYQFFHHLCQFLHRRNGGSGFLCEQSKHEKYELPRKHTHERLPSHGWMSFEKHTVCL